MPANKKAGKSTKARRGSRRGQRRKSRQNNRLSTELQFAPVAAPIGIPPPPPRDDAGFYGKHFSKRVGVKFAITIAALGGVLLIGAVIESIGFYMWHLTGQKFIQTYADDNGDTDYDDDDGGGDYGEPFKGYSRIKYAGYWGGILMIPFGGFTILLAASITDRRLVGVSLYSLVNLFISLFVFIATLEHWHDGIDSCTNGGLCSSVATCLHIAYGVLAVAGLSAACLSSFIILMVIFAVLKETFGG